MAKLRTVYPVAGLFLAGIPHAPISAEAGVARALIATGAYQTLPAEDGEPPEAVELSEEQAGLLPFFHNLEGDAPVDEPEPPEPAE